MNSIAENQTKYNPPIGLAWRFELGCLHDVIDTYRNFSEALYELNRLVKSSHPEGLYLLDRFALPGRPELWGVGRSGIVCISRRES